MEPESKLREARQGSEDQFADIHRMGVEEFGALWFDANLWAIEKARDVGDDPVKHKIMVSRVILATLRRAKIFGVAALAAHEEGEGLRALEPIIHFKDASRIMGLLAKLGGYFGDSDTWGHGQECREAAKIMKQVALRASAQPALASQEPPAAPAPSEYVCTHCEREVLENAPCPWCGQ